MIDLLQVSSYAEDSSLRGGYCPKIE